MRSDEALGLSVTGVLPLGRALSSAQVAEIRQHLARCKTVPGYLPQRPVHGSPFESYAMADVLSAPGLLDFALQPRIVELAESVIGQKPVIYSAAAFWTQPGRGPVMTQVFHRDFDEEKFLALFVYLTDFTAANGAAQRYVVGSHDPATFGRLVDAYSPPGVDRAVFAQHKSRVAHELYDKHFPVLTLQGAAGTAVLMQPYGLHCGGTPTEPRLLAWFRYGTGKNAAYARDGIEPVRINGRVPTTLTQLILK